MRGKLRIYLGPAPGVGKTYAMLDEGWRRRERGTDVVIGLVVTHDRPQTIAQIRDLEIIPPRRTVYRGGMWDEVDVDAIIARRPQVVLVDELAHSNVPGSANEKRWQDIEELLAAGIEVISTVNIQHLESVNDVVNRITGVIQRETVPDAVVRRADQIELVDMSPEALQRRMAHGNIYAPEKVDAALGNYFRARQPRRVARARLVVGRRSGRGLAAELHGSARHHELVGDPRAGTRRVDRCARRRRSHPQGGTHGPPDEGRPHRGSRRERRRAHSPEVRLARAAPEAARGARRQLARRHRRRRAGDARRVRDGATRDADRARERVAGRAGPSSRRDRSSTASCARRRASTCT